MTLRLAIALATMGSLTACASGPQPTEHLASSMAAVRGAQEAGAERVPEAALHLKLAEDQIAQAKNMMQNGDNARADRMAIRAYSDAELANTIARNEAATRRLESYKTLASGGERPPSSASTGRTVEPQVELQEQD
jgi:Domain of unknown function (DUF4398)